MLRALLFQSHLLVHAARLGILDVQGGVTVFGNLLRTNLLNDMCVTADHR